MDRGGDFDVISVFKDIAKYMASFDSRYIVISDSVRDEWKKIGLSESKMDLIYDGVRTEKLRPDCHAIVGKCKILFLGGYSEAKGQEMLLDAIINIPQEYRKKMVMDFFGNGDKKYKNNLAKKVKEYSLSGVVRINDYDPNIYSKISSYDIGINCSRKEGFGRVTVEYMLAGLCPIAANTGASPELITDKETGYLFRYGDTKELAHILCELIEHPENLKACGQRACDYAQHNFSMKKHAELIYQEYQKVLGQDK